jgi:hypothetical protein
MIYVVVEYFEQESNHEGSFPGQQNHGAFLKKEEAIALRDSLELESSESGLLDSSSFEVETWDGNTRIED